LTGTSLDCDGVMFLENFARRDFKELQIVLSVATNGSHAVNDTTLKPQSAIVGT